MTFYDHDVNVAQVEPNLLNRADTIPRKIATLNEPLREIPMASALSAVNLAIDGLLEAVASLGKRLDPVRLPKPNEKGPTAVHNPSYSLLVNRVLEFAGRINMAREQLETIQSELEI